MGLSWLPSVETLCTFVLLVFSLLIGDLSKRARQDNFFFQERDPDLSHPYIESQEIPLGLLLVLALLIPASGCVGVEVVRNGGSPTWSNVRRNFMGLVQAVAFSLLVTDFTKSWVARPRPNFFAFCDYKGYRQALATGDFESYFNLTVAGAIGDPAACNLQKNFAEATASFPSGHSSLSFAGLAFLSALLMNLLDDLVLREKWRRLLIPLLRYIIIFFPLLAAYITAVTRVRDYWHHVDDIVMGSLIGLGCTVLSYQLHFPPPKKGDPTRLLRSDLSDDNN